MTAILDAAKPVFQTPWILILFTVSVRSYILQRFWRVRATGRLGLSTFGFFIVVSPYLLVDF